MGKDVASASRDTFRYIQKSHGVAVSLGEEHDE